ncbi:MAG: amidophosphoribosyltransferase [Candidatus Saccharibacteria bacterium]|nr:amidophosphoribosyltransferase [Candidatus Saccharibacteria bacterium]
MAHEGKPVEANSIAVFEQPHAQPEIDKPQDECGVFAMSAPDDFPAGAVAWKAGVLQEHRGHSGSGMAFINPDTSKVVLAKGLGRLSEAIPGMMPINGMTPADSVKARKIMVQNRYSTAPSNRVEGSQPFLRDKLTIAMNGHLDNDPVKGIDALALQCEIDPNSAETDSDLLAMIMSKSLREAEKRAGGELSTSQLGREMSSVLAKVNGSYCLTMFYDGKTIGARDPWGVHPLSLGTFPGGKRGVIASETVALKPIQEIMPLESVRDFKAGELVIIDDDEGIKSYRIPRKPISLQCIFEQVYTSAEESVVNGSHVRTARYNMGKFLAEVDPVDDADMVIGVPSTGLPMAEGYSEVSGLPKVDAITKQPNAPRTFHLRGEERKKALKEKFIIDSEAIKGKSIVVVDDSTIKGNTARQLIQQLRDAGASEVHFRFASPPYISPCNLGMDTSDINELVARGRSNQEIAKELGADSVAYNTFEAIVDSIDDARVNTLEAIVDSIDDARVNTLVESAAGKLCKACTAGEYALIVPAQVTEERRLEAARSAGRLVSI